MMVIRTDRREASAGDRRGGADPARRPGRRSGVFRQPDMLPGDTRAVSGAVLVDSLFSQLPSIVPPGDLVVLNTTKVRHARLTGTRPSGAPAEVLLIHPEPGDTWVAMGKPGSALQPGQRVALGEGAGAGTVAGLPAGDRSARRVV